MGVVALKFEQVLETETCCTCGIVFAIPQEWRAQRLRKHDVFFCPAGHSQSYLGETEEARLRRMLSEANARTTVVAQRMADQQKDHEHERKRRKNGVCPCCNRSFLALGKHMATKHPDYGK